MKILQVEQSDSISGTSLKGYVNTTYDDLVDRFGEPTYTNGDKITAEWALEFKVLDEDAEDNDDFDYVTATIYDWKETATPMGKYNWHIGGFDSRAVEAVEKALGVNYA